MLVEPTPEPNPPTKRGNFWLLLIFIVLYGIAFVFGCICFTIYKPIRVVESIVFIGVTTSPVWLSLCLFLNKKLQAMNFDIDDMKLTMHCFISGIMLVFGTVYMINGQFDSSPEQTCVTPIISKHMKSHHSYASPEAYVDFCTKSLIPFLTLDDKEEVFVHSDEYDAIIEDKTTATITYKSGRYGIPWKVTDKINLPASSSEDR